jgi:hypothetical protein
VSTNPYAPPTARVADERRTSHRRSKFTIVVGVNAVLIGVLILAVSASVAVHGRTPDIFFARSVLWTTWSTLALAAAIGIFLHHRWAAFLWSALTLSLAALVIARISSTELDNILLAAFLLLQFAASVAATRIIVRASKH